MIDQSFQCTFKRPFDCDLTIWMLDEKKVMDSAAHVTEKPTAHQNQQPQRCQQQVLKCPRCYSLNTKFCYYNNYSLAQPRHFCKACKRYWTRGGTLRNVPMGGGCRKNKKIKKTCTTTFDHNPNPNPNPNLDHSTPSNNHLNSLYGLLPRKPNCPRFNTRVSDINVSKNILLNGAPTDPIHTKMNSFGLGFSTSGIGDVLEGNHAHNSMSLVSSYPSMFSGVFTSSSCNGDHTVASVLASSHQEQPGFPGFALYGDGGGSVVNLVQTDGTKSSMDCNNSLKDQNDDDQIKHVDSSDPTSFLWTISGGEAGEWIDPTSSMNCQFLS
ncbi:hypothetical protein L1987_63239 [Smallanthus sonchifolius]|uniref:Uncharacterized protein n=1 Tax=Smallanthus sonchifolius TaxID=185202 RepID=A0ACB9CD06_9ASTR|nr:hypothetical protein L1987_63239 [Smallanthus sonchifolius]